jgi:hypothetical protein
MENTITFDNVAKTVSIQEPTPAPTIIDGAHYVAGLMDEVTNHTDNIGALKSQKAASDAQFDMQIATEQTALDTANTNLANAKTQLGL